MGRIKTDNLRFTQIHQALIIRISVLLLIYSITRLVFYLINKDLFQETEFNGLVIMLLGGVRFDFSALLFINALYIISQTIPFRFRYAPVYQKATNWWFYITNAFFISMNIGDTAYYPFTFKRTTITVIDNFANETNLGALFLRFIFIDYWYLTILFIALIYAMVRFLNLVKAVDPGKQRAAVYYPTQFVLMLLVVYFAIIGMRGGFTGTTRPITLNNAGRYVERPKEMAIVLNTPFSIFKTLDQDVFDRKDYYSASELETIYTPIHQPKTDSAFRKKNVVIFILESFGREYIGKLNPHLDDSTYLGYTPFVDSLIDHSLTFRYSFANGGKSIDGIPAVISSLPSLINSYVLSNYSTNKTPSLARNLKKKGYHTAFFHGAPNGSMGFLAYTTINGFNEYYGATEYNNDDDYDGVWGIWDEEFFQFMGRKLNDFEEPFMATLFSVSSHHPYKVPAKYKDKFPKGDLAIHQVIGYTDYSLKQFFKQVSQEPWYDNTLFVFTADHTNQSGYREYKTSLGVKSVPIIFFDPSGELKGISNQIAQQIDIAPTVLGYLNYDEPYFAFGNDVLDSAQANFAISTSSNFYQLALGNYLINFDGNRSTSLYNFKDDPMLLENLVDKKPQTLDSLQHFLKAFVQQYNNRMIDDKLTLKP